MNSILGVSMALVSALSWSWCTILFKTWGKNYKPTHINLFNTVLSFIWLCIVVILTHSNIIISKESALLIALSGILGIVIADSIYYKAIKFLSPVTLTILSLVGSLFSGFWGYWLYDEIPNKISITGIFLLFVGAGIIYNNYPKNYSLLKFKIFGLFLGIMSSFLTTFSVAIIKPVLSQNPPITVTMYRIFFSSIVLVLYTFFSQNSNSLNFELVQHNNHKFQILGTSALYALGGLFCSMLAIKNCNLVIVSSIMSVQPFFVLLIMILFYKYAPKIKEFIGISLTIAGLLLFYIN